MKDTWIAQREKLLKVVETINLVPPRSSALASVYIKLSFKSNKLTMSLSSEASGYVFVTGTGNWPFKKDIFLDRRLLVSFILVAKGIKSKSDFIFSKNGESEMLLKNGTRKLKIACGLPAMGYAKLDSHGKEIKAESDLFAMLAAAKHCAEAESSVPELDCVFAKRVASGIQLYGTTGSIFCKAYVQSKLRLKKPLPVPLFIIDLLAMPGIKGIETTRHEVVLDFGIGKVWQAISAKALKKFPQKTFDKYLVLAKKRSKLAFEVDSQQFATIIQRLASYLDSVRRTDWVLTLKGKKGEKVMELVVTVGTTTFREQLELLNPARYDFQVDWALDRVIDVLTALAKKGRRVNVSFDKDRRAYVCLKNVEILVTRRIVKK